MDPSRPARPSVVVVTPVLNEEDGLPDYERAVAATLLGYREYDVRVLLVDDGSTDRSWEVIRAMHARDPRFAGVRLSRNFGSHLAISAGLARADGDAVAILACDLQDPPEVVLEFLARWRAGAQIVWGRRRERKDTLWRVLASAVFQGLIRRHAMPPRSKVTTGSFLLMDRRVADCVRRFHERHRVTFAIVAWTGFEQAVVDYDRRARVHGASGWTLRGMTKAMYDTFIGFSPAPVRFVTGVGGVAVVGSVVFAAYLAGSWLSGSPQPGWTSLMLAITTLAGVQFLVMGIMGEYLYRIYSEVVRRPAYFVSDAVGVREGPVADDD